MKFEVVSLNRGSSQSEDSPEQVHLDRIFNSNSLSAMFEQIRAGHTERIEMNNILLFPISVRGCALLLGWLFLTPISSLCGKIKSMEKEFVISILLISGCLTASSLVMN